MSNAPTSTQRVLITIPVKDEADRLIPNLLSLKVALDEAGFNYRLSIAEDGSTDGTKALLPTICQLVPGILIQDRTEALGRGLALRTLWTSQEADIYGFCDADLAAGVNSVVNALHLVQGGAEMVIGSRYTDGAEVTRPPLRSFVSLAYNGLIRFGFDDGIADHQCGLKVFSAELLRRLLPMTHEDSWFWDTEAVVIAKGLGVNIIEMPVSWVEKKGTKTPLNRLASDIYLHGKGLLRLKTRLRHPSFVPVSRKSVDQHADASPQTRG